MVRDCNKQVGFEGLGFKDLGFEVGGKVKGVGPCLGMITVARALPLPCGLGIKPCGSGLTLDPKPRLGLRI